MTMLPADEAMKKAIVAIYDDVFERSDAMEVVKAIIRALDAAGWPCVPRVATEEMDEAGWIDKDDVCPREIYSAMLDAAPKLVEVKR